MNGQAYLLLFVHALLVLCVTSDECSGGFSKLGKNCYAYIEEPENWAEAQAVCESMGGQLAEISDYEENVVIKGMVTNLKADVWIGGDDLVEEGTWRWASGAPVNGYTDWAPGEPDDKDGEDCMELMPKLGHWNDEDCDKIQPFICEKPMTDD